MAANLYETYATFYKEHSAKFGKKTAIFMLVGSFYELYDTQNPETGETSLNVKDITDSLGLQIAIHKGEAPKGHDGLVGGFPDYALHKWSSKLTSIGWTVVVVDQIKDSKGKVTKRVLARILSPSTHIENISSTETPYLTTIYFGAMSTVQPPTFGIASLDLTTGQTITYSAQASGRPDFWTADTLVQNLAIFQPKEVVLYWHSTHSKPPNNLRTILGLAETTSLYIRPIETVGSFLNELSTNEYLCKAFSIKSLLPPKEYLGLSSSQEELSLLFLLQFMEEHMSSINQKLSRNEPWVPNLQLVCGNHALTQLQIVSQNPGEQSVLSLFTSALTPMGKRGLTTRLLRPLTSAIHIQNRLDEIQEILEWSPVMKSAILKQLRNCYDLPRLHRKVLTGTICLTEFAILYLTYKSISQIIVTLLDDSRLLPCFSQKIWGEYRAIFDTQINSKMAFEVSGSSTSDITPFNSLTYPEIAIIETAIKETLDRFEKERYNIACSGGLSADSLRLEAREKEPFGIKGSKTHIQTLQKNIGSLPIGTHLSVLKAGGWVETPTLDLLNSKLIKLREQLAQKSHEVLLDVCLILSEAGQSIWLFVEEWITHIDVSQTIAATSIERGFSKPTIIVNSNSYVEINSLRHPLVEASQLSRVAYVEHNISLGKDNTSRGYLIYGMNASGKSTLMKATGVAVLLAQAGCYVPAKTMELSPFRAIYTRILNHDNLYAGLSSFAVEMSELRDILSAADHKTLVLGDELCSGTESVSAEALVASGIQWLSKLSAKYMFATHLHHLPHILEDTDKLGLKIFHLHVDYDPITHKLIYDRSLRIGSGSSLYGLEVARAMDLPLEFIEQALSNRHKILGSKTQQEATASTWNSAIVRRNCEFCESPITTDLEVHHIEPRALANKDGILPNGKPMNSVDNLVVLCESCHDKHHAGNIVIMPLIQTSNGPERPKTDLTEYTYKSSHMTKSKWSDEQLNQIQSVLKKYNTMSLKGVRRLLKEHYDIDISESTLSSIKKTL